MSDMNSDVLPPWSAIESHCSDELVSISLWGREYEFCRSPFPSRIESAGRSLLASPVRLSARVEGELVEWEESTIQVREQTAALVTFLQRAESPAIVLTASTSIEYDGLIRIDWKLVPRHRVQLDSLTVDIPLSKEHASLFYYCPRRDRVGPGSGGGTGGLVPADGFATGFCPYVWLGDEQRGLAWFSESPQKWSPDGSENAIEIIPSQDEVILRLRLVTDPVSTAPEGEALADLSYTFGLQATPVRPIEKDAWDTRIYHVNQELAEFSKIRLKISEDVLDNMVRSGVRTVCIHEHWTDIEGYFTTDYGEDLKQLVANCHERGMQILLYFGFLISDLAPEWPTIGAECVIHPDDKGCYVPYNVPPQPVQNAYSVCYNSRWHDITVEGIANVITQYGIDGLYLDGTTTPWGCRNPAHGCGYRRRDGKLGFTYPIFAVRELMKRLYVLVMRNNPDGQVNIHSSHYLTVPTIAWTTGYTDGEQFAWDEMEQKVVADVAKGAQASAQTAGLPLDRFRCEFMGHQLGVPADFLADVRGPFSSLSRACSFALLHDVPVRIWMRFEFELQRQLWKVRDDFGCKGAEWLPYWRNSDYVNVQPEGVYCSLHRHPENGVLAVVSNLGSEEQTATADFSLSALGVGMDAVASDALNGDIVDMQKGTVMLRLSSLGFKLLRVKKR
jgi:hypothetical protein